jgi:L-alanine-DL-glutamate epimerase-like enolase superfamily enzyme
VKIRSIEATVVEIPFVDGGRGEGITPTAWRTLETALVRIEDEQGNVGWGEGFGYFTAYATKALIDRLIAPLLPGTVIDDIPAWNLETQKRLHLFGRYGPTIFAVSGVDIALWDLAAKRAGLPLYRLLGGVGGKRIGFYASLVRYGDADLAAATCLRALEQGFTEIKLHETTLEEISGCRQAVGSGVPLSVDVNCAWPEEHAAALRGPLVDLGVAWLEEPTFPPEEYTALARLRGPDLAIAAGENWCTAVQFAAALAAGAVDWAQPSVTKVGGISEFLAVAGVADGAGVGLLPHCPYFGPGYFASLHLAAALPAVARLEYLFVEPEAWLADPGAPGPDGRFAVPEAPGLGFEPDPSVVRRYRRAAEGG